MIQENKVAVFDIDGTLCEIRPKDKQYIDVEPDHEIVEKLREYKNEGVYIILYTSRQMKTHQGNMGKVLANTGKVLFEWLDKHNIPYDEIHFGKPWCAKGFYVDDKAVRPSEILDKTFDEVVAMLGESRDE
jgi:capsule biosynthesis phosphatase